MSTPTPSIASTEPTSMSSITPNGPSSTTTGGTGTSVGPSSKLPKLPIPKLEDSMKNYLRALEGLQDEEEHARTVAVVNEFLTSGEGARWQKRLEEYSGTVDSYIEEFWCACCFRLRLTLRSVDCQANTNPIR